MTDLIEIFLDESLLLDKFDIGQRLGSEFNGLHDIQRSHSRRVLFSYLIKSILAAIADINNLDDLGRQPLIEHVTLTEFCFEVRASSKDQPRNIDFVIGDKMLNGMFSYLPDIVVPLLVSKTRETQSRLSTTTMFLRQIDGEFVDDFAGIAGQSTKECAVTIHHNKAKARVGFQKLRQGFSVKFIVAEIKRPGLFSEPETMETKRVRTY